MSLELNVELVISVYAVSALNSGVAYVFHGLVPYSQRLAQRKGCLMALELQ